MELPRDKTWAEHFAEHISTLTNPDRATEWASAAEEIMRGAVLLDEDQVRREDEYAADDQPAVRQEWYLAGSDR